MSKLPASLLAQTIDDHIAWLTAWSRIACFETSNHEAQAEALPAPESFAIWRRETVKTMQEQPALQQMIDQFDQLHRAAKMAVLKTPEGTTVARQDFTSVTMKFQELYANMRRIERAASTADAGLDPLTGMRSRTGMADDLNRELGRFRRTSKPFCVAMFDIDHFKKLNDTYGHEDGDRVLVAVANHISRQMRSFDDAWRWGGEEFLICFKEADLEAGFKAAERVRSSLERLPITISGNRTIFIAASIGVADARVDSTVDNLIARADRALYKAKEQGRNRVLKAAE